MRIFIFFILLIFPIILNAQEAERELLQYEFTSLLIDLSNSGTIGYKAQLFENNYFIGFDFSQGMLMRTGRQFDFSIIGNGFFKLNLIDARIAYSRAGEFTIDMETNELKTIDGHSLYDRIIIPPGFIEIYINNNILYAIYPNGEILNCGEIYSYELDTEELYTDTVPHRTFEQMLSDISDLIDRTDGMLLGIRNNGRNDRAIFFYRGENESISDSIIVNTFLEYSNVDFFNSYIRLFEIMNILNTTAHNKR